MNTILIIDDDKDIRDLLKVLLLSNNYQILEAANGDDGVALCKDADLIILDVMMPKKDGYETCSEIRTKTKAPILFLTAKGQEYDKMIGFSAGGDDYLVKPFTPLELLARINALLRRWNEYGANPVQTMPSSQISIGQLTVDEAACKVLVNGDEKKLTAIEFRILHLMCKNRGKVFSAQNIYESVWEEPYFYTANNTVMVHIRKLREKIEIDPQNPEYIKTVWGMGYKIDF